MLTHAPVKESFAVDEVQEKFSAYLKSFKSSPSRTAEEKQKLVENHYFRMLKFLDFLSDFCPAGKCNEKENQSISHLS
jgi:hypothetical protein